MELILTYGFQYLTVPAEAPEPIGNLMRWCWMKDPADRPTFEKIDLQGVPIK
jgi:hypothetical protein